MQEATAPTSAGAATGRPRSCSWAAAMGHRVLVASGGPRRGRTSPAGRAIAPARAETSPTAGRPATAARRARARLPDHGLGEAIEHGVDLGSRKRRLGIASRLGDLGRDRAATRKRQVHDGEAAGREGRVERRPLGGAHAPREGQKRRVPEPAAPENGREDCASSVVRGIAVSRAAS